MPVCLPIILKKELANLKRRAAEYLPQILELWIEIKWFAVGRRLAPVLNDSGCIIVSLTSYPPRFDNLHLTLKSLLMQRGVQSHVVLWISAEDLDALPHSTLKLTANGISILTCEDLRSYKKIIPALEIYPTQAIAIADDDTYYWPTWLAELVSARNDEEKRIPCHRAHRIKFDSRNLPKQYSEWEYETLQEGSGPDVFATGVGGVLYPPKSLSPNVGNKSAFMRLAESADDIWLYFMARENGWSFYATARKRRWISWKNSQVVSLNSINVLGGANDKQIWDLTREFGWPR